MQQIAAGIGSAAVTSVYFAAAPQGQVHAVTVSLIVVAALSAGCLLAVLLLPRRSADIEH